MKKLLLFLLVMVSMTGLDAQPVDMYNAKERARIFLMERGLTIKEEPASARQTSDSKGFSSLYVFNAEEENGFVIVSGDERTDDILGYTTTGHFCADSLAPNFKEWLQSWQEGIENLPDTARYSTSSRCPVSHPSIEPLLTTRWGQGEYYNALCPVLNGEHCPTGCGATVVAQLLNYYQYPLQPTAAIPGYRSREVGDMPELQPVTFDWTNMKTEYRSNEEHSEESVKAISELMLYCGCAMKMDYASGGSATTVRRMKDCLLNYMGCNVHTTRYVERRDYSTADWDALIYNELSHQRPVIYSGYSENEGGHVFACDGYREGFYHINWGWDGKYDGYYRLFDMNPYQDTMAAGFSLYQDAIIGILPASDNSALEEDQIAGTHTQSSPHLSITDVVFNGNLLEGIIQKMTVTVRNHGADYTGSLYLFASKTDEMGQKCYRSGLGIGEDCSESVSLCFLPEEDGEWNIWITTDSEGNQVLYSTHASILPLNGGTAKLEMEDYRIEYVSESTARLTMSLKNVSAAVCYSSIWVMVSDGHSSNKVDEIRSEKKTVYPGETIEHVCILKQLEANKDYFVDVWYFPTYGTLGISSLPYIRYTHASPDGIDAPLQSETAEAVAYYTPNGIRIPRPKPGLNIVHLSNGTVQKWYQ